MSSLTLALSLAALAPSALAQAPYRVEEVRVKARQAALAASLYLPVAAGPVPAVVLIDGSGAASRGSKLPGGFSTLGTVADHLARRGFAAVHYDKPGTGGSGGDWRAQSIEDRAADVLELVRFLRRQPQVDPLRVGLLGHSQGGWVAVTAAALSDEVAFAVLMAGPSQTVREQTLGYERREWELAGLSPGDVSRRVRDLELELSLASWLGFLCRPLRLSPMCFLVDYDPAPYLERLRVPVLALYGGRDIHVPPDENIPRLRSLLERAGNRDHTVVTFPEANHWFWAARTGSRAELAGLEAGFVPGFLESIGDWLTQRFGP